MKKSETIAYIGILSALSLILGYVESLIPIPFPVPGMKLGLSNIMVVIGLYILRKREALLLLIIKILLTNLLFGSFMSLAFSAAGGLLSFLIMVLMQKNNRFSIITVSLTGGLFHNIGQLFIAGIIMSTWRIIYYFPVLAVTGVVTGVLIGVVVRLILIKLRKYNQ